MRRARQFIDLFKNNWDDFKSRFITYDETGVQHHEPDTRQSGMEWREKGEIPPKKFKIRQSLGKFMATFFWDCHGVIFVDYLPRGQTITGQYYASLLKKLREQIKEKRRGTLAKGVLLLHDNARVHSCGVSMATIKECSYELIPHAPFSPDTAPFDYHLFPNLKDDMRGKGFETDEEVKSWIEEWIGSKSEGYFLKGIDSLLPRLEECIKLRGDYFDK